MMDLTLIPLPESARAFVADMAEGCGGLCARTVPELMQHGRISAVLPQDAPMSIAERYKTGGVASGNETYRWLTERIERLATDRPGALVIQDIWMGPNDKGNAWSAETWKSGQEFYFWSETGEGMDEDVIRCMFSPRSFCWFGFLVADSSAANKLKAGNATVDELASSVIEIYVPAYDGESFLIWTR